MSHEINIVLGILFFTQKYSLCLHASDEISGSDIDVAQRFQKLLVKTAYHGSVWQHFQKPVPTWISAGIHLCLPLFIHHLLSDFFI